MRTALIFVLLCTSAIISYAQSRAELEKDRLEIIQQIETTQKRLAKAESNKESTLSQLNALEKQIDARNALIANLQQDANLSTDIITTEQKTKEVTASRSTDLTEDYNTLLRIRYRNKLLNKNLASLYNTERLNEVVTKWNYLKSYSAMLTGKSTEISKLDEEVLNISASIETETSNHSILIEKELAARDSLKSLMKKLTYLATQVTSEQKSIKQILAEQTLVRERYNKAIEQTIFNSIGNAPITSAVNVGTSTRTILDKKGFLPWPLKNAKLTSRHGPQPHPTVEGIIIDNKGIDLTASTDSVSAIYAGEVLSVASVRGSGMTVIIRHQDDIYSVYSNLANTLVQQQAQVEQGATIGLANTDDNGQGSIHFEIYQGKRNLNPNHWLKNN